MHDYSKVNEGDLSLQEVVYISGPIRADTREEVIANIERAEEMAIRFTKEGFPTIMVHSHARRFLDVCVEDTDDGIHNLYICADQALVARCDTIVMLSDWRESAGCRREKMTATALGLTILDGEDEIEAYIEKRNLWTRLHNQGEKNEKIV